MARPPPTGMITTMLELARQGPCCRYRRQAAPIDGYGKAYNGQSVVIEACECHETFLHLTCNRRDSETLTTTIWNITALWAS